MRRHLRVMDAAAWKAEGRPAVVMVNKPETGRLIRQIDEAGRVFRFVVSDDSIDRHGDVIDQRGWELDAFRKTGSPILWAHDSSTPPVARAARIFVEAGARLVADIEFPPPGTHGLSDTLRKLVAEGFLKSTSVGFRPLDVEPRQDPENPFGLRFLHQELLEVSLVGVPANANAVMARAKALGLDPAVVRGLWPAPGDIRVKMLDGRIVGYTRQAFAEAIGRGVVAGVVEAARNRVDPVVRIARDPEPAPPATDAQGRLRRSGAMQVIAEEIQRAVRRASGGLD